VSLKHSDAVARIRLAISMMGGLSVPYTVGTFRAMDSERAIRVGTPGVSDVIACIDGRAIFVEVKVGADRQRDEQKSFQRAAEKAGALSVLAKFTDKEDGVSALKAAALQAMGWTETP
jgi:hypothetical protein